MYSTTLPSIGEAARDAIVTLLQNNLTALNNRLAVDSLTSVGTLTTSMIVLGDTEYLPDVATAPVLICVTGGGRFDGLDSELDQITYPRTDYTTWRMTVYTNINIFIHPDAMFVTTDAPQAQAAKRERLRQRLTDWARSVLNSAAGGDLTLGSQELVSGVYDHLQMGQVISVEMGIETKGFAAGQALYYAHLRHMGYVQ